jgi:hypothetical protein
VRFPGNNKPTLPAKQCQDAQEGNFDERFTFPARIKRYKYPHTADCGEGQQIPLGLLLLTLFVSGFVQLTGQSTRITEKVYLGHGTTDGPGQNPGNTNRFITATQIGTALANIPTGLTNKHKYRFVCLDGCNTASGKLPEAFGVLHKEDVQYNFYGDNSLRPNTFVGWKNEVAIAFASSISTDHVNFWSHFQFGWLTGMDVKGALNYASGQPDVGIGFSYSDIIVFGYWGLKINAYNR